MAGGVEMELGVGRDTELDVAVVGLDPAQARKTAERHMDVAVVRLDRGGAVQPGQVNVAVVRGDLDVVPQAGGADGGIVRVDRKPRSGGHEERVVNRRKVVIATEPGKVGHDGGVVRFDAHVFARSGNPDLRLADIVVTDEEALLDPGGDVDGGLIPGRHGDGPVVRVDRDASGGREGYDLMDSLVGGHRGRGQQHDDAEHDSCLAHGMPLSTLTRVRAQAGDVPAEDKNEYSRRVVNMSVEEGRGGSRGDAEIAEDAEKRPVLTGDAKRSRARCVSTTPAGVVFLNRYGTGGVRAATF